jgi:glycosyltransferase involved in cell wall biosynthesis
MAAKQVVCIVNGIRHMMANEVREQESVALQSARIESILVVIMPALNEEATIASVIERIPRTIEGVAQVEVVVIDDGSTDRTVELSCQAGAHVVSHPQNMGVGKAFASGIDAALKLGADIIVNMDSDGQFDPEDIPILIRPILEDGYGFVTCTRFGNSEFIPEMPRIKKWGNRMMCRIVNWVIWNASFTDVSCGFRAYTRSTALRLNLFGDYTYTQESFIDLAAKKIRMTEVPLRVRGVRQHGTSRVASNLWKYALETLPIILRAMRDTRPLKFFGLLALAFFALGVLQAGFVTVWWLLSGHTSPWTSMITIGAACLTISVLVATMALMADQIGRLRKTQEQLLLLARRRYYSPRRKGANDGISDDRSVELVSQVSRGPSGDTAAAGI